MTMNWRELSQKVKNGYVPSIEFEHHFLNELEERATDPLAGRMYMESYELYSAGRSITRSVNLMEDLPAFVWQKYFFFTLSDLELYEKLRANLVEQLFEPVR